ncbi:MAG: hypothetical protein HZC02_01950 [Candidatus Levybacteria bacterium]|nr:hypothetical protein [Candidatus Levybacteria bacterium]
MGNSSLVDKEVKEKVMESLEKFYHTHEVTRHAQIDKLFCWVLSFALVHFGLFMALGAPEYLAVFSAGLIPFAWTIYWFEKNRLTPVNKSILKEFESVEEMKQDPLFRTIPTFSWQSIVLVSIAEIVCGGLIVSRFLPNEIVSQSAGGILLGAIVAAILWLGSSVPTKSRDSYGRVVSIAG